MSRKWLLVLIAVVGAIAAFLSQGFGLSPAFGPAAAGLVGFVVYVFNEAKADYKRLGAQAGKWKDPKFLITLVSAIVGALGSSGVNLPVSPEVIIAVLTAIVGVLFKVQVKTV